MPTSFFLHGVLTLMAWAVMSTTIAAEQFDNKPWLDDLAQIKATFSTQYANFEWTVFDREIDMGALFAETRQRIESASSDADARAALDRLIRRLGDGHVELHWATHGVGTRSTPALPCDDFDAARAARPLVAYTLGYASIQTPQSDVFPIGILTSAGHRIGVIKIRLFDPSFHPEYCRLALASLATAADRPCDDACQDKIRHWTQMHMNSDFVAQVKVLERAGIDVLLVDLAGNGGGSEWADAAARMLTRARLVSPRYGFVRGAHWVKKLSELESNLRQAASEAPPDDREMLLAYAVEAEAKRSIAATACDASPLWEQQLPACRWLGEGFYQTGLVSSADPKTLRGKPWAPLVFTPMQYEYVEGLWSGPLMVLVDGGSASSSERFAAELQTNHAALIIGEPTAGAVGGHTDGGTATTLTHSGATLLLPDVCDLPSNGRYATGGVVPDLLIGFHRGDGPRLRAAAFREQLPAALKRVLVDR